MAQARRISPKTLSDLVWLLYALCASIALIFLQFSLQLPAGASSGDSSASSKPEMTPTVICPPSWQIVPSPNGNEMDYNILYDIAAIAHDDVWAVGSYQTNEGQRTLALHWDGVEWSIIPTPDLDGGGGTLYSVDGIATDDVWAVGNSYPFGQETLTIHWDGTTWSKIPSPSIGKPAHNFLYGVSAIAEDDVWAVGYYLGYSGDNGAWLALILHWNGVRWTIMPTPNVDNAHNMLRGVVALANDDVWAVGDYNVISIEVVRHSLTMHWNGDDWRVVHSPIVGNGHNTLTAIDAVASDDIWAVGSYQRDYNDPYEPDLALTLHWNGDHWQPYHAPNPGVINRLTGITAVAADDVWAVGRQDWGMLLEHWNGNHWSVTVAPAQISGIYNAIDAIGGDYLWAVGTDPSHRSTLTAHYPGPCIPTTPTPTPTACPIQFNDVQEGSTFYEAVRCLACRNIVNGYADGTFRPNENVTRGQLAKLIANSAGFQEHPQTQQSFQDVWPYSTFWQYIGRLEGRGYVSGYACGGENEPCIAPFDLPYYRPGLTATRGQAAKIISDAALYNEPPSGQLFEDVPPGHPFYMWVQRMAGRGIIGGYPCGGPGEPCIEPGRLSYFRPGTSITRGQLTQILARTFYAGCVTP